MSKITKILIDWGTYAILFVVAFCSFGWVTTPLDQQSQIFQSAEVDESSEKKRDYWRAADPISEIKQNMSGFFLRALETPVWLYHNWSNDTGSRQVDHLSSRGGGRQRIVMLFNNSDSSYPIKSYFQDISDDDLEGLFAGSPIVIPYQPLIIGIDEDLDISPVSKPLLIYTGNMIGVIFLNNCILLVVFAGYLYKYYLAVERRLRHNEDRS